MQTPEQVIEAYFLENRHMLIEVAAFLDRYDAAVARTGETASPSAQMDLLRKAIDQLGGPAPAEGRAARMLDLFS